MRFQDNQRSMGLPKHRMRPFRADYARDRQFSAGRALPIKQKRPGCSDGGLTACRRETWRLTIRCWPLRPGISPLDGRRFSDKGTSRSGANRSGDMQAVRKVRPRCNTWRPMLDVWLPGKCKQDRRRQQDQNGHRELPAEKVVNYCPACPWLRAQYAAPNRRVFIRPPTIAFSASLAPMTR
jgi:hypothetical protein